MIDPLFRSRPLRSPEALKKLGFGEYELREHAALQKQYIAALADLELAEMEKRFEDALGYELLAQSLAPTVHFRGEDPSEIPLDILKYLMQEAIDRPHPDHTRMQYRARVKSKAPAIRAKCVTCMGDQPALVRECPSTTCVLWPFRMGSNPLRGAVAPPTTTVIVSDEIAAELAAERVENEDGERDAVD